MRAIKEYKREAKAALSGNWSTAVGVTAIFVLIIAAIESPSIITSSGLTNPANISTSLTLGMSAVGLVALFIMCNLETGYFNSFRVFFEEKDKRMIHNMFNLGFKNYFHILGGFLLVGIICFLGALLLIIPGIILGLGYSMVPFILVEEPQLSIPETLKKSREMMKGHKWQLFLLELSFIGWIFLSIFTLGIGLLWVEPYVVTTMVAYYEDLKEEYKMKQQDPSPVGA